MYSLDMYSLGVNSSKWDTPANLAVVTHVYPVYHTSVTDVTDVLNVNI
jgi:hypothetical protein